MIILLILSYYMQEYKIVKRKKCFVVISECMVHELHFTSLTNKTGKVDI